MLNVIANYLSLILVVLGLASWMMAVVWGRLKKNSVTPRAKSWLFFTKSMGFWSLVIGSFMIAEKLLVS